MDTYHIYTHKASKVLKRTLWYKMKTDFDGELIPQIKEGITKVEWVMHEDLEEKLRNSYGNIRELFS